MIDMNDPDLRKMRDEHRRLVLEIKLRLEPEQKVIAYTVDRELHYVEVNKISGYATEELRHIITSMNYEDACYEMSKIRRLL